MDIINTLSNTQYGVDIMRQDVKNVITKWNNEKRNIVEMPGIEPGAFHMQSERSTAELQPHI